MPSIQDDAPHVSMSDVCRDVTDNDIGVEGGKAIAAALEPRKNPDGSWAFNGALNYLDLSGECQ